MPAFEVYDADLLASYLKGKYKAWTAWPKKPERVFWIPDDLHAVREYLDEVRQWIESNVKENGLRINSDPDGPAAEMGVFFWKGALHSFSETNWRLLRCIWNRDGIEFLEVNDIVWKGEAKNGTIRNSITRLNTAMEKKRIPLEWNGDKERFNRIR